MFFPINENLPPVSENLLETYLTDEINELRGNVRNDFDRYLLSFSRGFTSGFEEAWIYAYFNNLGVVLKAEDLLLMMLLQYQNYVQTPNQPLVIELESERQVHEVGFWGDVFEEIAEKIGEEDSIFHDDENILDEISNKEMSLILATKFTDILNAEKKNYINPLRKLTHPHGIRYINLPNEEVDLLKIDWLVNKIMKYDHPSFRKYLDIFSPVISEIVRTRREQLAPYDFWGKMIKIENGLVSGWINCFYGFSADLWIPFSYLKTPEISTKLILKRGNDSLIFRLKGGFAGFKVEDGEVSIHSGFSISTIP